MDLGFINKSLVLKKSNSNDSLKSLVAMESIKKTRRIAKHVIKNKIKFEDEDVSNAIDGVIEPMSFECGNKITDFVEKDLPIDFISGDDFPMRNAVLVLLYGIFKRMKELPTIINENSVCFRSCWYES